jgi:hypothetical protein
MPANREKDHQYALDVNGRWVNAKTTRYEKYQEFFCDCPEKHKMKLVKPSGQSGKRIFCDYFAHVNTGYKKQKTDNEVLCNSGGESIQHRLAKHRLRELVGIYYFPVFRCHGCLEEEILDSTGCSVSMEITSKDKKWRYDCLLSRESQPVAALEVVHMHLTSQFKAQSVRESGMEIAEFRVEDVLRMENVARMRLENLKVKIGKCQACVLRDSYVWLRDCYVDELFELITQEEEISENYSLIEKMKIQHRLWIESLLRKSEQWVYHCFIEEITEWEKQESIQSKGMMRESDLRIALQIDDIVERCKALLVLSLFRLRVNIPLIGVLSFERVTTCSNGLLVYDFNERLPTKMMFIYLVHNRTPDPFGSMSWKHGSVEPEFHIFLNCSTVFRCFSSPDESIVTLKDCRWPILKEIEKSRGICANCHNSFRGHTSDTCKYKFCRRCGRKGHMAHDCYARKDILNQILPNPYHY